MQPDLLIGIPIDVISMSTFWVQTSALNRLRARIHIELQNNGRPVTARLDLSGIDLNSAVTNPYQIHQPHGGLDGDASTYTADSWCLDTYVYPDGLQYKHVFTFLIAATDENDLRTSYILWEIIIHAPNGPTSIMVEARETSSGGLRLLSGMQIVMDIVENDCEEEQDPDEETLVDENEIRADGKDEFDNWDEDTLQDSSELQDLEDDMASKDDGSATSSHQSTASETSRLPRTITINIGDDYGLITATIDLSGLDPNIIDQVVPVVAHAPGSAIALDAKCAIMTSLEEHTEARVMNITVSISDTHGNTLTYVLLLRLTTDADGRVHARVSRLAVGLAEDGSAHMLNVDNDEVVIQGWAIDSEPENDAEHEGDRENGEEPEEEDQGE